MGDEEEAEMPGYWIVRGGEVKDVDALKAYNDIFAAVSRRYSVEIIAGKGRLETVEGHNFPRQFILRFDSFETAMACYQDAEYQASLDLAARAYDREVSIVEGPNGPTPAIGESVSVPSNLEDIDASAWTELETAAASRQSGFRYLNLCSVDSEGKPQARMVVLRRADAAMRGLEFHTDTRSPKWQELSANPHVTVLGFCAETRLQLRLQGLVELSGPGSDLAKAAWDGLSIWTRMTYTGGPPGDERAFEGIEATASPESASETDGKAHFGVVIFRAEALDWFQLRRQDNRRALFTYDATGARAACQWVNP